MNVYQGGGGGGDVSHTRIILETARRVADMNDLTMAYIDPLFPGICIWSHLFELEQVRFV